MFRSTDPPTARARRASRLAMLAAAGASLLALPLASASASASASTSTAASITATGIGESTFNLPSMTESGGAEYMAWAGTDTDGLVNVAKLNSSLSAVSDGPWTYGTVGLDGPATANGTGPGTSSTTAGQGGAKYLVVVWVRETDQAVMVDSFDPSSTNGVTQNYGFGCQTKIGVSPDTATITSQEPDGAGALYVSFVNPNGEINVDKIDPSSCAGKAGSSQTFGYTPYTVTNATSWDGPALISDNGSLYLAWAGFNSPHYINIAPYKPGNSTVTATVETNHATLTDMGGMYDPDTGLNWISYCGTTNDLVYFQNFTGSAGGTEQSTGATCTFSTYNGIDSGGVGVAFNYTSGSDWLSYGAKGNQQIYTANVTSLS